MYITYLPIRLAILCHILDENDQAHNANHLKIVE
jgi:hypothetical protein